MRRSRALTASLLAAAIALPLVPIDSVFEWSTVAHKQQTTVIDVWLAEFPFPGYLDERRRQAEEFNQAHPEYEIRIEAHFFAELPGNVHRAALAGDPPEVANFYFNATQIAHDLRDRRGKPLFTSVEQAIGDRRTVLGEPVVLDDLLPQLRSYYSIDGDLASMPVTAMTSLIYANTTLLQAAGVAQVPQTWDGIEAACEAIAQLPDGPEHCITWPNHNWFFQQAVAQQGGLLANRQNGRHGRATRTSIFSRELLEYAAWWRQLHRDGHYLYTGTPEDWGGTFEAFVGQQVAFTLDAANQADTFVEFGNQAGFEVGAGRLPFNGEEPLVGNLNSGDSLFLRAGLDRETEDGALAFMQFLNSPRNAAEWHKSTSYLPVNERSIGILRGEGWFEQHPAAEVAIDQIRASKQSPAALGLVAGGFDGIQNEMLRAMDGVLRHEDHLIFSFWKADLRATKVLRDYNRHCVRAGQLDERCLRVGLLG